MTDRPTAVEPGRGVLEEGRARARLSARQLWVCYLGLGGDATVTQVEAFLDETEVPALREYNLLVDAVNERLMDNDVLPRLAYAS